MTELMLVMMISEMAVTGDKEDKMLTVKCYLVSEDPFSIHKLMQIVMSSVSLLSATYPINWNKTSKQITSNDLSC